MALKDMTGERFGRLTVIRRSDKKDAHATWWVCQCDCGNIVEVRRSCLIKGFNKSCGCLNKELSSKRMSKNKTKHGYYGTRIYNIWHRIKGRCCNENDSHFSDYGGRGIDMCEEWKNDPKSFIEWSLENGYDDALTIDRVDNNKGYSPDNCRWISYAEQQTNKRNNVRITYKGKTQCVAEWARELGVKNYLIYQRIAKGWQDPEEILFGRRKENNYGYIL